MQVSLQHLSQYTVPREANTIPQSGNPVQNPTPMSGIPAFKHRLANECLGGANHFILTHKGSWVKLID